MTALPIPAGNRPDRRLTDGRAGLLSKAANSGLVFNKFVDRWAFKDQRYDLHQEKKDWLACFSGPTAKAGNDDACTKMCARLSSVARQTILSRYGREPSEEEKPRDFLAVSRFATGLGLAHPVENGCLWHHTLGVPYIPGSSIKGMMRAWAHHWGGVEHRAEVERLFGDINCVGALVVFDALPLKAVECVTEVLTPHDGGWRLRGAEQVGSVPLSPGDWHDPVPVFYLAVEAGAAFRFTLGAAKVSADGNAAATSDVALGYRLLTEALEWIGIGAKTSIGFGRFEDESNRPLVSGDRVKILNSVSQEALRGRTGTVEAIFEMHNMAKLKLDGGGKGSNPMVGLDNLSRIEN